MHNVSVLVKGKPRCTAHLHPDDAAALGLADGDDAIVRSRVGEVRVPVEVTDAIRRGVVSIPHGWGHDLDGVQLAVAAAHAGVNSNLLADETLFDPISGNAVLNGIPVDVRPAPSPGRPARPACCASAAQGLAASRSRRVRSREGDQLLGREGLVEHPHDLRSTCTGHGGHDPVLARRR